IGEFVLHIVRFQYKNHRVLCSVKIVPTPVTHFEREARNDYHWMTADRWARLESGLWRLLENLATWKDARKLHTELMIDHINVRVQATEGNDPSSQCLLSDVTPDDLTLDIQLQYISHEDTTIVGVHTTNAKVATEALTNGFISPSPNANSQVASRKPKAKARGRAKPDKSTPKHIDADGDGDDNGAKDIPTPVKPKRERRSASQAPMPQRSPVRLRSSRGSSVGPMTSRRSARSPVRPGHFQNYILGAEKRVAKGKAKKTSAAKEPAPVPAKVLKVEKMDEGRMDALQRLDSMLVMQKPPEVDILLLEDMTEQEVLSTFDSFKDDFESLFKERENKLHTSSYMNIGHIHIMDILNKSIHKSMMSMLAKYYSKRSAHASLIVNALLPLWIVRLLMKKHKMSEAEALTQIISQMKYSSYQKADTDEPL
ncbi:hypothetical protein KR018_011452, partial [Drosophila ironensis]